MAIVKAAARLILEEHGRSALAGPVLCLGVPDVYLTAGELQRSAPAGWSPGTSEPGFVTADQFLRAMGLTDVTSVDIPGSAHAPDRIHDLNAPLPDDLVGRFGVVIDPGTTEHVFDMRMGLINTASALRVGGVVIHFVPVYSYNGGYFSINPNVLHDFYEANGFDEIRSYIVMWDRFRPYAGPSRCYRYTSRLEPRHALADRDQHRFTPHLLFFAKKAVQVTEYASPIQHEDGHGATASSTSRVARSLLPESAVTYLSAALRRRRQLRSSRRDSFRI